MSYILRFLASEEASHVCRSIKDEVHEFINPHPERAMTLRQFGYFCAEQRYQCIYLGASNAPHIHQLLCKKASINPKIKVIRQSTDRPNLSYQFLRVDTVKDRISLWDATKWLTYPLKSHL